MSRQLLPLTAGSLLTGQVVTLHKDFSASLLLATVRSCEAGCVGYQKVPWIATIGDEPVWTGCGAVSSANNCHELVSHASLPATAQWGNVAVISYQPASMVVRLKLGSEVFAHFPMEAIAARSDGETSVIEASGRAGSLGWALARAGDAYLGLGCSCLRYRSGATPALTASSESCFWVCVVGTAKEFGCYDNFVANCCACTGRIGDDGCVCVRTPAALCRVEGASLPRPGSPDGERVLECHFQTAAGDHAPADDAYTNWPPEAQDGANEEEGAAGGQVHDEDDGGVGGGGQDSAGTEGSDAHLGYGDPDEDFDASDMHEKGFMDLVGSMT